MAIATPVSLGTNTNKASASVAITTTAAADAGDIIIVAVGLNDGTVLPTVQLSVSDSAGNSYTYVTRQDVNADAALGSQYIFQCNSAIALASSSTITATSIVGTPCMTLSAVKTSGVNPVNFRQITGAFGNNGTPTATQSGLTNGTNYLALAWIYTEGPSGDTFTQDTAGGWAAPPDRVGTTGGGAATNNTSAGGYEISNTTTSFTYAPTITSRPWAEIIVVYQEKSLASSNMFFVF